MKKIKLKLIFSVIALTSIVMFVGTIAAAPVKFKQVVQVVNAKPGKANTAGFAKLRLAGDFATVNDGDGDDDKKKKSTETLPQDGRVITTTISEIDEDAACDCVEAIVIDKPGFPKWTLFGLGAVPLPFIKWQDGTPTPTPTTETPTPTPTTQTPTPPPVPEPMTLLLFGTGLAGVGMAARKKFGKKTEDEQ